MNFRSPVLARVALLSVLLGCAPWVAAQSNLTYVGTRQAVSYQGQIDRACPFPESPIRVAGTLPSNLRLSIQQNMIGCPAVNFYGTIELMHPAAVSGTVAGSVFNPTPAPDSPLAMSFNGTAQTLDPGSETHDFWVDLDISGGLAPGARCMGGFPHDMATNSGNFLDTLTCAFPSLTIVSGSQVMSGGRLVEFSAQVMTHVVLDTGHGGVRCCDNRGGKYDVTFTTVYKFALEGGEVSPAALSFSAVMGGPRPGLQSFTVKSLAGTSAFTAMPAGLTPSGPVPAWLSLDSMSGMTPALIAVRVDPGGLDVGMYGGRIQVTIGNAAPVDVMVSLEITAGTPELDVAPSRLRFGARSSAPGTVEQPLLISNKGGGAPIDFTASVRDGSTWIKSLAPASGQAAGEPTLVRVQVDSTGLAAGVYADAIQVKSAAGNREIPVTLVVNGAGPLISLGTTGAFFPARQNQGSSQVNSIRVRNLGDSSSTVNWTAKVNRGTGVVKLGQTTGSSTVGRASMLDLSLADGATASAGARYALIEVADPQARNSPQYVVAVVNVTSGTPPVPLLLRSLTSAGVRLDVSSAQPVAYTAATGFPDALGLSVAPASGTVSSATPATLQISSTKTPPPGVYYGTITAAIGDQVSSVITSVIVPPTAADVPGRPADGCTPTRVAVIPSGIPNHFSIPAGWPATLTALLANDCGTGEPDGSIVATFSNGDPPITLTGDRAAVFSATWQPSASQADTTVKLTGTSGGLMPATLEITGDVEANAAAPPVLAPGGLLHNLNPVVGEPLAPGTVTQIYGDNLAAEAESASAVPLPTVLSGTEAIIGPASAPLYFISKMQLTAQLPAELDANQSYAALVAVHDAFTLPETVDVVPVAPGTVAFIDGRLVAQHADFSLVSPENPATPGEALTIYLVGMGATDPAVASGVASPADPLAYAKVKPVVTVDGQTAELFFWGLTPNGVGLYQINFAVPQTARAGELDVVITQDGVEANATRLVVAAPAP